MRIQQVVQLIVTRGEGNHVVCGDGGRILRVRLKRVQLLKRVVRDAASLERLLMLHTLKLVIELRLLMLIHLIM
jgi:hypothetical protein